MQKKKGISLIVLVITIIVMIILAATVIISLTGNSVIDRANEAVETTNLANVQQLASTLWVEARLDGAKTKEDFEEAITKGLEGYDTTPYKITVTTKGVKVKLLSEMWIKKGFTVVKGDQVLEIGDVVNYDETAGGTKTVPTNVTWKVLGADEDGNLQLMSTTNIVSSYRLGYESSMTDAAVKLEESQKDWLNAVAELDGKCEPYSYGKGIVGKARSITVEDIDSVTGYDKTTYAKAAMNHYGNEVTYSYNGTVYPSYTYTYTSEVVNSTINDELITSHSNGFYYYDGKEFKVANDLTTKSTGTITTLKSNYYEYTGASLSTISKTDNAKAYQLIFGNDDARYHIASVHVRTYMNYVTFGSGYVTGGKVMGNTLCRSNGESNYFDFGIRAVVTLSSDITFTGNSTDGWSY